MGSSDQPGHIEKSEIAGNVNPDQVGVSVTEDVDSVLELANIGISEYLESTASQPV